METINLAIFAFILLVSLNKNLFLENLALRQQLAIMKQKTKRPKIKHGDNFILCAVMALEPDQNLYVAQDGRWLGGYVPAAFRGYAFSLQNNTLHIDEASGLVSEDTSGQALYDNNGDLTKPVQEVLNFLQQIEQNRTVTVLAVAALPDAGCITEWQFKDKNVTGLYRADEPKLNILDDQTCLKLRKAGSIAIAYAQLFSMANIQIFDKLAKMQEQAVPRKSLI